MYNITRGEAYDGKNYTNNEITIGDTKGIAYELFKVKN